MENLSKALLLAAAMLMTVLILSLLVMAYNRISDYYKQEQNMLLADQLEEFNKVFENYHRNNVRGTDLISLMNRVIDYNERQSYLAGTEYPRVIVNIDLQGMQNAFKYQSGDTSMFNTKTQTTGKMSNEGTGSTSVLSNLDKELIAVTDAENDAASYLSTYVSNVGSTQLDQLASNISNIMLNENPSTITTSVLEQRLKRQTIIKRILNIEIALDSEERDYQLMPSSTSVMQAIKDATCIYYQYVQFKRAYFDCTDLIYDSEAGRVIEIDFKLQVKNGTIVFN